MSDRMSLWGSAFRNITPSINSPGIQTIVSVELLQHLRNLTTINIAVESTRKHRGKRNTSTVTQPLHVPGNTDSSTDFGGAGEDAAAPAPVTVQKYT